MKIFLFRPDKNWSHCGGAIVIVAKDFDQSRELLEENKNNPDLINWIEDAYLEITDTCENMEGINRWVLQEIIDVNDSEKPRIVLVNYNYA